jgi:hypothetical protein
LYKKNVFQIELFFTLILNVLIIDIYIIHKMETFDGFKCVSNNKKRKLVQDTGNIYNTQTKLISLLKEGIECQESIHIKKAYDIINRNVRNMSYLQKNKNDIIYCLFFHYEFSHGNLEKCDMFLSLMDNSTMGYERHYLKYCVLNWWINERVLTNRIEDKVYNHLLSNINKMLDNKLHIEVSEKNAYQIIRDLIFYFKVGLYTKSFNTMKQIVIDKFRRYYIIDPIKFEIKLLQRINLLYNEINDITNGYIYLGVIYDDMDVNNYDYEYSNIIRFKCIFE